MFIPKVSLLNIWVLLVLVIVANRGGGNAFTIHPNHKHRHCHHPSSSSPTTDATTLSRLLTTAAAATTTTTETEQVEWDEEDFVSSIQSLDDCHEQLASLAKITSTDPSAIQRASDLLDELYQVYLTREDSAFWPTTETYNRLLEVYAYSASPEGGEQADLILRRLVEQPTQPEDATKILLPKPNRETYALTMVAWMRRGRLDQVEELLNEMKSSNNNDNDCQPNIYIYNKVLKAYGMAGQPERAQALLEELLDATKNDDDDDDVHAEEQHMMEEKDEIQNPSIRPNQDTWVQVLRAYANPRLANVDAGGVAKIEELMGRMARGFRQGHESWKPSAEAFDALLMASSHRHHNASSKEGAKEAERILYTMVEQYQDGEEDMRPTNDSFFHVLRAYRNTGSAMAGGAFKVEKLLQLQDALAQTDDAATATTTTTATLQPNAKVLNAAIAAMARARDSNKAIKAKRVLERLEKETVATDNLSIVPYKNLLNACAFTRSTDPEEKLATFQIAVDTLNKIRDSSFQVDSSIFALFLKSCSKLMPPTKKRDAVIENVFRSCCKEGYLDKSVLREFQKGASKELHLKIMGGFLEDGVEPPEQWARNVLKKNV